MKKGVYDIGFQVIMDANPALSYGDLSGVVQYGPAGALKFSAAGFINIAKDGGQNITFTVYNGDAVNHTLQATTYAFLKKMS